MAIEKAVSENLRTLIRKIMRKPYLDDFFLGGGTSLALMFEHRQSIDVDLFSEKTVGTESLDRICRNLMEQFPGSQLTINNKGEEQYEWISGFLVHEGENVKLDMVQNMRFLHPPDHTNGIRTVNPLDVGSFKLESMADRGSRKDLYDLLLLSNKYGLDRFFSDYLKRMSLLSKKENRNIFNMQGTERGYGLLSDLGALLDINEAKDMKNPSNRIVLAKSAPSILADFITARRAWEDLVIALSKSTGIKITHTTEIPARRKKRGRGI